MPLPQKIVSDLEAFGADAALLDTSLAVRNLDGWQDGLADVNAGTNVAAKKLSEIEEVMLDNTTDKKIRARRLVVALDVTGQFINQAQQYMSSLDEALTATAVSDDSVIGEDVAVRPLVRRMQEKINTLNEGFDRLRQALEGGFDIKRDGHGKTA